MRGRFSPAAAALLAAVVGGVALWRRDLAAQAGLATLAQLSAGGAARWLVLGEAALLAALLAGAFALVPRGASPARDAAAALAAAWAGFVAEAWGTRAGLWSYYTGERPPLWIVPAWPIGVLMIERAASAAERRWGGLLRSAGALYWAAAPACAALVLWRTLPWLGLPQTAAVLAAVLLSLFAGARPERDLAVLAAGAALVLPADLWGTTNGCWGYAWQGPGLRGAAGGVAFGMAFDASLALGCLKLARLWEASAAPRSSR